MPSDENKIYEIHKAPEPDKTTVLAHVAAYPEPNLHLVSKIGNSIAASDCGTTEMSEFSESRTELDSHANMCVVGKNSFPLTKPTRYASVNAFSPSIEKLTQVPIIDAAIIYECPFSMKRYVLVMQNALLVKAMDHNLIPPFVMREAGLFVNETAKIHSKDPTIDDHCIRCDEHNLRIPLALWGIFSYFPSRAPTNEEVNDDLPIIHLTPDSPDWNPNSEVYARNEESMIDWRGEIVERKHRKTDLIQEADVSSLHTHMLVEPSELGTKENEAIDCHFWHAVVMGLEIGDLHEDKYLSSMDSTVDPYSLVTNVNARLEYSKFGQSVGAMYSKDTSACNLFEVDAVHGEQPKGVTADQLMKIWSIDEQVAKRTLEITTQLKKSDGDSMLSRNVSTNDRMLRYRRLKSYFFSDTFFVTKKAYSTRGNTCMQMYVSDKGFVYVAPMKSKGQFLDSLKLFAKEVGVPFALVEDPAGEQTSSKVKLFCQQIGTTLRMLEEGTQWANRAELYVGLFKEGIRKDMRMSNSPLVLWDYCAERKARIHNLTARNLFQLEGQTHTWQPLVKKVTSQRYATLAGMSGVILGTSQTHSHFQLKNLDVYLVMLRMPEMRWPNGY